MKTIIVSDIHIGNSKMTRVVDFIQFLKTTEFDQIIFNGDIIDFLEGDSVKAHWIYVKEILRLVNGKKVYYLPGNHDKISLLLIPFGWMFGISVQKHFNFSGYRIEHGDWIEYYLYIMKLFNKKVKVSNKFHENVIEFSKWKNKQLIVGHSHETKFIENQFYDDGCWLNMKDGTSRMTYILINNGNITLEKYEI